MNNKHISDLTVRLSQALDQNYDVVNMDAVLSVISALEGATITKEQLEATRLAKYINQLRRRTKSEQLARRAKSLLKTWREMVVFQTNELTNVSIPQQQQHHHHRSHPTSPTVVRSMEHGGGVIAKQQSVDFLRSTASNPATTSTSTGSASLNLTSNKRQASVGGLNISAVPSPAVPVNVSSVSKGLIQSTSKDIGNQPTSFANLLTGVSNAEPPALGGGNTEDFITSHSSRKLNKRKDRFSALSGIVTKNFVIDHSSSSNTEFSRLSTQRNALPMLNIASEVIDIPDSNSDSEINVAIPMSSTNTSNLGSSIIGSSNITPKVKKPKKEKKRKGREQQQQSVSATKPSSMQNVSNIIEESCSNQLRPTVEQVNDKFVPIVDDRSRIVFPISGISEILSLSNSSMNSMFPNSTAAGSTAVIGSTAIEQTRTDLSAGINSSSRTKAKLLSTSDLTFAGKFKSAGSSDLFGGFNLIRNDTSDSNTANAPTFAKASSSHPFVPFNNSGRNSNDSTSNSRTSQFDIIDVVNQDNSQSKIIDQLRKQHKKKVNDLTSTTTSIITQQQSQNKPLAAASWSGQVLVPPKSTNNSPTFNPSVDSTAPSCDVEQKIPKKRGRKKGSKGVDSVIAKETSLCSQMFITTLGTKKVKTTKELYTEMQNRKFGISSTTSSPTLSNWLTHQQMSHMSRPNSSCSEPSLHSPRTSDACSTNATVSTVATRSTPDKNMCNNSIHGVLDDIDESYSDYNTSDPSRDSTTAQRQLRRRLSTDSNSNSHPVSKVNTINLSTLPTHNSMSIESIEKQIKELLSQLPPVQLEDTIMWECNEDVVPCTCKVTEVEIVEDLLPQNETSDTEMADVVLSVTDLNKNEVEAAKQPDVSSMKLKQQSTTTESDKKQVQNKSFTCEKPTKSIFDLDFDEDEDPLHKFVAEAAAKHAQDVLDIESLPIVKQEVSESKTNDVAVLPAETNIQTMVAVDQSIEFQANIIIPTFKIDEDPNCLAKELYEIQTQKVTQFHVTALHNCYIPNVNGNWDNAETSPTIVSTLSKDSVDYKKTQSLYRANSSVGLWFHVVPQYGSLIDEFIPKDLSDIHFTANFKHRKRTSFEKRQRYVPFLGVAKKRLKLERFKNKSNQDEVKNSVHENCHKVRVSGSIEQELIKSNESDVIADPTISETNNSNDVYIKDFPNNIIVDKDLISEQEQQIKKEHNAGDNSNNLIGKDILIGSEDDEMRTQTIISNEILESNKVLTGITIDIEDDDVGVPQNVPTAKYTDSANSYLLTVAKLPDVWNYHSYENQNNNNGVVLSNAIMLMCAEDKSTSNATPSTLVKNVDSRRSSSCSNSSLKQTQHSINLKLRRRRLQQQKDEENKSSTSEPKLYGKTRRKSSKLVDDETAMDRKPRLIKRIKIAINGDIATQRQISIGSSNTDEDEEEDDDCFYSTGSRSSPIDVADEYNVVNEDCEEEEYIEDDDDEDEEDDEDDDYAGDFHEVVTRDISATSTGNNHIVLTIKKTPSKTNSPSDSLSAISPVIVQAVPAQPLNNLAVTKEEKATAFSSAEDVDSSEKRTTCENDIPGKEEYDHDKDKILTQYKSNINHIIPMKLQGTENNSADVEKPASFQLLSNKLKKKRLKRREKKKGYLLLKHKRQKLHRQLFFPYELQTSNLRESILNISSCSSSCAEESNNEYESITDCEDESKQNNRSSFSSLQSLPKKNLSSSSSSSTCSNTRLTGTFYDTSESKLNYADTETGDSSFSNAEELVKQEESAKLTEYTSKLYRSGKNSEVIAAREDTLNEKDEARASSENHVLSIENNGLLKSFNNIYLTPEQVEQNLNIADDEVVFTENATNYADSDVKNKGNLKQEQRQQQKLPFENCDVYNNFYNNNNNSKLDNSNNSLKQMVRSSSNNSGINSENIAVATSSNNNKINNDTQKAQNALSSDTTIIRQLIPHKEYRTGLRAVDEDVDDEDGNNCARIQQFKEWHQVLQLRSYNDELLTVLPYVVLE